MSDNDRMLQALDAANGLIFAISLLEKNESISMEIGKQLRDSVRTLTELGDLVPGLQQQLRESNDKLDRFEQAMARAFVATLSIVRQEHQAELRKLENQLAAAEVALPPGFKSVQHMSEAMQHQRITIESQDRELAALRVSAESAERIAKGSLILAPEPKAKSGAKCPECAKFCISMDFHELATMYACPHGHHYGVFGPDDVYTELRPVNQPTGDDAIRQERDRLRATLLDLRRMAADSIGSQYGTLCAKMVEDLCIAAEE